MHRAYLKLMELSLKWHLRKHCRRHLNRMVKLYGCDPWMYRTIDLYIKAGESGDRWLTDWIIKSAYKYQAKPDAKLHHYFSPSKYPINTLSIGCR